jgi:hypothetical protein
VKIVDPRKFALVIDPLVQARALWLKTRPLPVAPDNAATDGAGPVADNLRVNRQRRA